MAKKPVCLQDLQTITFVARGQPFAARTAAIPPTNRGRPAPYAPQLHGVGRNAGNAGNAVARSDDDVAVRVGTRMIRTGFDEGRFVSRMLLAPLLTNGMSSGRIGHQAATFQVVAEPMRPRAPISTVLTIMDRRRNITFSFVFHENEMN
ncbi:hypothetical protein [Burkholderia anthina]|uniref:hypothetical protein n=1 Tax=Burkholderia anthina TaxID=179879 RepID=UPI001581F356|nr:hypothetical protein [Burkholderia anthina]